MLLLLLLLMWMVLHVEIRRVLQMQLDTQMRKSRRCARFELYYKYSETSLISRDQCAEYVENSNIKVLLDVVLRIAFF